MNKSMEYMAFELPAVAFDLRETRVGRRRGGVRVGKRVHDYAKAIVELIDDEPKRVRMAAWDAPGWRTNSPGHQEHAYLSVYSG